MRLNERMTHAYLQHTRLVAGPLICTCGRDVLSYVAVIVAIGYRHDLYEWIRAVRDASSASHVWDAHRYIPEFSKPLMNVTFTCILLRCMLLGRDWLSTWSTRSAVAGATFMLKWICAIRDARDPLVKGLQNLIINRFYLLYLRLVNTIQINLKLLV